MQSTKESVAALGEAFRGNSALLKHEVAYVLGQMLQAAAVPFLRCCSPPDIEGSVSSAARVGRGDRGGAPQTYRAGCHALCWRLQSIQRGMLGQPVVRVCSAESS